MTDELGQPSLADALRASLMKDELVAVSCLNGELVVGDRVAVAVGGRGSGGSHMRLGTVVGFKGGEGIRVRVGVEVEQTSSYVVGSRGRFDDEGHYVRESKPYVKWYDDPSRIVKVA